MSDTPGEPIRIYDVNLDTFRPITQLDVTKMQLIIQTYAQLVTMLDKELLQSSTKYLAVKVALLRERLKQDLLLAAVDLPNEPESQS